RHVEVVEVAAARSHDDDASHVGSFRAEARADRGPGLLMAIHSGAATVGRSAGGGAGSAGSGSFGVSLLWRQRVQRKTGMPAISSMSPFLTGSAPAPQIAHVE